MISALFWLAIGSLLGAYNSERVRGAVGWALGRVRRASAPKTSTQALFEAANATTRASPPGISWSQVSRGAMNVLGFLWHWRNLIVIALVCLVLWRFVAPVVSFVTCPFGGIFWCATKNEESEAIANERANTQVAQLEARVGALAAQLAQNTANDARRVDRIITEADEGLTHAAEAVDAGALYDVYRSSYERLWNDLAPAGEPDPAENGPDALRGLTPSPV